MKPFRFGLLLSGDETSRAALLDLARRAEEDGYDILLGTDHLSRQDHLTLLQAAAEATRLRIGTLVLNNDFRHPVLLAQELATLDVMTDGRLEIGLGAGWARDEYDGAALSFDRPGQRLARLQSAVEIVKQALSEGRVERPETDAYGPIRLEEMPRSVQRPHPPLLIGGGGPRTLRYAAQVANIVGLDPRAMPEGGHIQSDVTEALFNEKIGWLRDAAPDRVDQLEINVIIFDVDPSYRPGGEHTSISTEYVPVREIARSPHYLTGDTEAMADQLRSRRERWGINYLAIKPEHMGVLAPVIARLAGT